MRNGLIFLAACAIVALGAPSAMAQQTYCCPQMTFSTGHVGTYTFYKPLEWTKAKNFCGRSYYSGKAEVYTGHIVNNCLVRATPTGQVVSISGYYNFRRLEKPATALRAPGDSIAPRAVPRCQYPDDDEGPKLAKKATKPEDLALAQF